MVGLGRAAADRRLGRRAGQRRWRRVGLPAARWAGGRPAPRRRNDLWTSFGPTNVAIHGIAVAVELGDVPETIRRAEQVNTTALPADLLERRASVYIDLGRAYVQRRDDAAATAVFRQAEELAPEEVHYSVPVREALREMLKREHRYATPELRPLARRTGIIS